MYMNFLFYQLSFRDHSYLIQQSRFLLSVCCSCHPIKDVKSIVWTQSTVMFNVLVFFWRDDVWLCSWLWIWYWLYYRQLQIFWVYSIIRDCLISYCFPFYVLTSLICCIYSSIGWFCQMQTSGICKAGFKKSDILHLPSHQHQINNWCTLVVNYYSSLYLTTTSGDTRGARVSNYLCSFYLTPGLGMHPLIAV